MSLDKDFYIFGEYEEQKNLRTYPAFTRTIPSIAPSEEFFFMLSQGFNLSNSVNVKPITPKQLMFV